MNEILQKLRKEKGLSQEKLAELAGVAIMTVNSLEKSKNGSDSVRINTLKKIACVLKCNWKDLVE